MNAFAFFGQTTIGNDTNGTVSVDPTASNGTWATGTNGLSGAFGQLGLLN